MNKKQIITGCLLASLAATAVGGTLAYFTDTDSQKNTFTTGNVDIVQLERQRTPVEGITADDQNLYPFQQDQTMVPAVGKTGDDEVCADQTINEHMTHFIDTNETKNVMDKIVNVRNDSTIDIYAATLIAVEDTKDVSANYRFQVGDTTDNKGYWTSLRYDGATSGNNVQIKDENGTVYTVSIKIYDNEIAPNAYSPCALTQVYMKPTATAESVEDAGDTYDIICLSLGTQAAGFEDAQTAIETSFSFDIEALDAEAIKTIAGMFGENFTAGYYTNGGFQPLS